ncbi:sensor histidine kinase [Microbacterium sp. A588]
MSSMSPAESEGLSATATAGPHRIARSISATWWYTVSALMVFQFMVVLIWFGVQSSTDATPAALAIVGVGGLLWCASCVALLLQYRHRDDTAGAVAGWRGIIVPLAVSAAVGVGAGLASGLWIIGALPLVQALMLLNWPRGVRLRLVIVAMALMTGAMFVDLRMTDTADEATARNWWMLGFFSILLPAMTVTSLWWWDVLATLDRARAAESRLGATQERLRVATDVHDLQGHHLQVIALQLELSERLLEKDPDAALDQIRLARASVAEARQGTRDLAMRFRGVPLRDEIANAVDLLRAAGTTADAEVDPDSDHAPASVLGPIIRETTTNALRHGGGKWAHLSLTRDGSRWRYEIANDSASDTTPSSDGSGLEGISRRVAEVGGSAQVHRGKHEFSIVVLVPSETTAGEKR